MPDKARAHGYKHGKGSVHTWLRTDCVKHYNYAVPDMSLGHLMIHQNEHYKNLVMASHHAALELKFSFRRLSVSYSELMLIAIDSFFLRSSFSWL